MFYWLIILIGTIFMGVSLSNPFYKLTLKKYINLNIFLEIMFRIFIFFFSIVVILMGIYLESIT